MTISRQEGFRLRSRSILMAILGLGFLVWTPVSAVAEPNAPNAEVEAFIKADSVHDSNARFLDVYESLDGDREKIVKALMQAAFASESTKMKGENEKQVEATSKDQDILIFDSISEIENLVLHNALTKRHTTFGLKDNEFLQDEITWDDVVRYYKNNGGEIIDLYANDSEKITYSRVIKEGSLKFIVGITFKKTDSKISVLEYFALPRH